MAVITSLDELRAGRVLHGEAIAMRAFDAPVTVRPERDEVLYVLEDDEGIYVPAGHAIAIERGTVLAVSGGQAILPVQRIRLNDRPIQQTGDRWYRELIQTEITQFVGSIPPGRAPDHFHLYEEVLCILMGSGFFWADGKRTAVGAGSCIYLPKRQVHCLENSGSGELRLLGVFYPAGSPAARYGVENSAGERPTGG